MRISDWSSDVCSSDLSVGSDNPPSAVERKLADLLPPDKRVILRDVEPGMRRPRLRVRMGGDDRMGKLYPFSLREKLAVITEPSPWYEPDATTTPWSRGVIPQIGRAHVCTPVTNAQLVCRLLLAKTNYMIINSASSQYVTIAYRP